MTEKSTKTVAYIRVSTDKQADRGVSLDAQRAKVDAYAALYDLELVEVVVEAASASKLTRPGLATALEMVKAGAADALLVVKLDRLTRSVRDLGDLVETYFAKSEGPALMSVSEQIDTRSAAGRLVLNVLASVSQWERETIGERTAAAMAHKKANREYCGGSIPFGWQLSTDGAHIEPNAEEQGVLDLVTAYREEGLSLRAIGSRLSDAGIMNRRGNAWNAPSINGLLRADRAA